MPYYNPYRPPRGKESRYDCERVISVEGIGSMTVEPDIVQISTGVVTMGEDAKVAQNENQEIMSKVISSIKANGVEDKDIKTVSYLVRPDYDYTQGGKTFKGYEVRQLVQINVRDIENADKIINDAIESGANIQQDMQFRVSNYKEYYDEALDLAVTDSFEKAMNIAESHGMVISEEPVKLQETSSVLQQGRYRGGFLVLSESETTETGTVLVQGRVSTEFQIL